MKFDDVLVALMAPLMVAVLNWTMFGISIVAIRADFAIPEDLTAWLTVAFFLPLMITPPFYGTLSDVLGKRRLLLIGLLIFLGGTLVIFIAPSLPFVILGRVIQGIGGGRLIPSLWRSLRNFFTPMNVVKRWAFGIPSPRFSA